MRAYEFVRCSISCNEGVGASLITIAVCIFVTATPHQQYCQTHCLYWCCVLSTGDAAEGPWPNGSDAMLDAEVCAVLVLGQLDMSQAPIGFDQHSLWKCVW